KGGTFGTPIQWAFSIMGALLGIPFGKWIANRLGYYSGWRYNAVRIAAVAGGAVLGWFSGRALISLVKMYVSANPSIFLRISARYGPNVLMRIYSVLNINGIGFFGARTLSAAASVASRVLFGQQIKNAAHLIQLVKKYFEAPKKKLNTQQIKYLITLCQKFGLKIEVKRGDIVNVVNHKSWNGIPHIHIGNSRIHVALTKDAVKFIRSFFKI
ncbi:hypothetical protein, partial [Faecalibacillus intestinalis]